MFVILRSKQIDNICFI